MGESNFFLETFDINLDSGRGEAYLARLFAAPQSARCGKVEGRVYPAPALQDVLADLVLIQVAAQELDGGGQALLKGVLRCPAGQLAQLGGIAQQAVDFALFGAQALGLADDLCIRVDLGDQLVGQIADGMFNAGGNVQLLADGGIAVGNRHKAVGRVLDIVEVAGGGQAAEFDFSLACQQLCNNRRDDGAAALARAIGVEGAHDGVPGL